MRKKIIELRPVIGTIDYTMNMTSEESFQNKTIRPILKFQNELLLLHFKEHLKKHPTVFETLKISEQERFIQEQFQKDIALKNVVLGMVIGLFTTEEYVEFKNSEKEFKKRITDMIIQRLQDQLGYFET